MPPPWHSEIQDYFLSRDAPPDLDGMTLAAHRLPPGPHWGIIPGFEDFGTTPFDRAARAEELLDTAAAAGATLSRVQIDWANLETAPGIFDQAALDSALADLLARNQSGFVTLSTLDSEGLTLPDYLSDGLQSLRPDLSLDAPEVLTAFETFAAWLVPQLTAAGVWGLALGNEVEIPVEDGIVSVDEAANFFGAGISHVQSLDPELAVTVTLTVDAAKIAPVLTEKIVAASDIFSVNFYGIGPNREPRQAVWAEDLDAIRQMASGRPIFFQELGMPVGYADAGRPEASQVASSTTLQEAFFDFMGQEIARDDQILGATVFQLMDWSTNLTSIYLWPDQAGAAPDHLRAFVEALETIGLVAWSDGIERPAWSTWLNTVETSAAIQALLQKPLLSGTSLPDDIAPDAGSALIYGQDGDDTIIGTAGDDAADLGTGDDFASLGDGDDIGWGGSGDDEIQGGAGRDALLGGAGNDHLLGQHGDDDLDGGLGIDVAGFSGLRADYTIERGDDAAGWTISDTDPTRDGTDNSVFIERLAFADGTLALDVEGTAGQAFRLYEAAFDRLPDLEGLGFWIGVLDRAALTLNDVAAEFLQSDEFAERYGQLSDLSDDAYLDRLYINVLDRAPDDPGFAFWRAQQDAGLSRAEVLRYFSESEENKLNTQADTSEGIWFL